LAPAPPPCGKKGEKVFKEIPLTDIVPSPLNPRRSFSGDKFDELCASIKQKGVIEPIIVREIPSKKGIPGHYEIVAGERRFKASCAVKLETIPAIVRELSDDEAYDDFMLVENLQRDDLTELEEATSFKAWTGRHGEGAVKDLAEKVGIRPGYIRGRIEVLSLPKKILAAWEKGELAYGHLAQILRIPDERARLEVFAEVMREGYSVAKLRAEIDDDVVPLAAALFNTAKCASCPSNSTVQKTLFDIEASGKAVCMKSSCFAGKQGGWLNEHWPETDLAKSTKTPGFIFADEWGRRGYNRQNEFGSYRGNTTAKKCFSCINLRTIIELTGERDKYRGPIVCLGDRACFLKVCNAGEAAARATTQAAKKKAVAAGNAPRVSWHGEYFRNRFFKKRVPEILKGLQAENEKAKTVLLMCLAHANQEARSVLRKVLGLKDEFGADKNLFSKFLALPYEKIEPIFRDAVKAMFIEGQDVGDWSGLGSTNRRLIADFLGVDLAKEFSVDEEYLAKKTKNELLAFGKKSGVFADPKVIKYLAEKMKGLAPEKLKKSELIDVFLKSGVDLVGKVPAEILKVEK
jgi:ParB/RepB/Spo0J family partition protein